MPAEAVTITPHDPRGTAFRAIVAALKADAGLAPHVAVWLTSDGDGADATALGVRDNAVMLTPVFERESPYCVTGGKRTWECPVTVQVAARVASANADNAINLAGLFESALEALTPDALRAMGISWLELVQPAAQAVEYGTSIGAFRFVVHIKR